MPTYQIKDWDKHFENNKSREREHCSYVAMPNKQHGMGFTRIMAEPDGAAIFGIWTLILQAASQQAKPRNGWLTDDGQQTGSAWTPEDLALRWRRTVEEVERALTILSSDKVGWLSKLEMSAEQVPAECPPNALEEKRRERKETALRAVDSSESTAHQRLFSALQARDGPISDGAAQGKAIKWLLSHGYDEATCVECLDALRAEDWRTTRVSWLTVQKEIGARLSRRAAPPKKREVVL